jgi:hypothetical protein
MNKLKYKLEIHYVIKYNFILFVIFKNILTIIRVFKFDIVKVKRQIFENRVSRSFVVVE